MLWDYKLQRNETLLNQFQPFKNYRTLEESSGSYGTPFIVKKKKNTTVVYNLGSRNDGALKLPHCPLCGSSHAGLSTAAAAKDARWLPLKEGGPRLRAIRSFSGRSAEMPRSQTESRDRGRPLPAPAGSQTRECSLSLV